MERELLGIEVQPDKPSVLTAPPTASPVTKRRRVESIDIFPFGSFMVYQSVREVIKLQVELKNQDM